MKLFSIKTFLVQAFITTTIFALLACKTYFVKKVSSNNEYEASNLASSIVPTTNTEIMSHSEEQPEYYDSDTAQFLRNYKIVFLTHKINPQPNLGLTTAVGPLSKVFKVLNQTSDPAVKRLKPNFQSSGVYKRKIERMFPAIFLALALSITHNLLQL